MNMTDEEFMASLPKEYPDVDWDTLPSLDSYPDVFVVSGKNTDGYQFSVNGEYATIEEAQIISDRFSKMDTTVPGSVKIDKRKPREAVSLHIMNDFRKQILNGEKVFPIYLP